MLGKAPNQHQFDLFKPTLKQIIDPKQSPRQLGSPYPLQKARRQVYPSLFTHRGT